MRFGHHYLTVAECSAPPKTMAPTKKRRRSAAARRPKSQWMKTFHFTPPDKAALSAIPKSSENRGTKLIR
jgi:hypothetical protein